MATIRLLKHSDTTTQCGFLMGPKDTRYECIELKEFMTVGRERDNTLVIDDIYVSSRHARIEKKTNGFIIKDLRSRNGTFVNGTPILEAPLREHDSVRFGKTEFIFTVNPIPDQPAKSLTSKNIHFREQLDKLPQIAGLDIPVLILGPSGSGKELIARAVHDLSPRAKGPYVSVNCSALSEALVESELFGHLRGSFTGATHDRKGAFEAAREGTLFLDEVGDLPLSLQPKLLRALENQEIRPVGSDRAVITDVRIVAATHQSLSQKVQKGQFRMDLYYRLQGIQITPPALKDRLEDFDDLLFHFAREMKVRFSFQAMQEMKRHQWPGNIRELKNAVARAKALFGKELIEPEHIIKLLPPSPTGGPMATVAPGDSGFSIKNLEKELILARLYANRGNQRKTAEELGMAKSTLHDRIRAYGIDLKSIGPEAFD